MDKIQSLGAEVLRHQSSNGRMCHVVEPPHLRLEGDDSSASCCGSNLSRPANILINSWGGDSQCCMDLVGMSPARGGWRYADSAL